MDLSYIWSGGLGPLVLNQPTSYADINLDNWTNLFSQIGGPLLVGTAVWSVISGLIAYIAIQIVWRIAILSRRRKKPKTH